jgi:hypothetical protein
MLFRDRFDIGMDRNFVCYGADTISPFLRYLLIYEINYGFLNNSNLHAIISKLLIINLQ